MIFSESRVLRSKKKYSKMLPLVLLITSIAGVMANGFECPTPEDIFPCFCSPYFVTCSEASMTTTDLERSLKSLKGKETFNLKLENLKLGNLSLPIFKNLRINIMEISNCKLESILDPDMENSYELGQTIKALRIIKSINDTKGNLKLDLFSLKSLLIISLSNNNIKHIRNELFSRAPNAISYLTMFNNGIETIGDEAFSKMSSLGMLELKQNRIQTVKRSMLPSTHSPNLYIIDFSFNNISRFPEDIFWKLPSLIGIYISKNNITEFPERTWRPVWSKLRSLGAHGNPLNCDSRMEWIFKLKRPNYLSGECISPLERKGMDLDKLIDQNTP